MMIITCNTL